MLRLKNPIIKITFITVVMKTQYILLNLKPKMLRLNNMIIVLRIVNSIQRILRKIQINQSMIHKKNS